MTPKLEGAAHSAAVHCFSGCAFARQADASANGANRLKLELDVPAEATGTMNIITVDSLAKAAIRIMENPANHKKIFHLSHPNPPTHQWTLDFICNRFNVGGFNFAGAGAPFTQPRNRVERMVWRQMQTILDHFCNNPLFDRTNTETAVPDLEPCTDHRGLGQQAA